MMPLKFFIHLFEVFSVTYSIDIEAITISIAMSSYYDVTVIAVSYISIFLC